jgi:Uncharacterized protein conserved in bacteria
MKKPVALIAALLLLAGCASKPTTSLVTPPPAKQTQQPQRQEPVRGIWLTTVSRLDWPPVASVNLPDEKRQSLQKKSLTDKLDKLKSLGINTVYFQVKPDATALWPSKNSAVVGYADRHHRQGSGLRSAAVYAR